MVQLIVFIKIWPYNESLKKKHIRGKDRSWNFTKLNFSRCALDARNLSQERKAFHKPQKNCS